MKADNRFTLHFKFVYETSSIIAYYVKILQFHLFESYHLSTVLRTYNIDRLYTVHQVIYEIASQHRLRKHDNLILITAVY